MQDHAQEGIRKSAILAISAMEFKQLQEFGESRGIEVLGKPFEMANFLDKVSELVRKHRTQQ